MGCGVVVWEYEGLIGVWVWVDVWGIDLLVGLELGFWCLGVV